MVIQFDKFSILKTLLFTKNCMIRLNLIDGYGNSMHEPVYAIVVFWIMKK